MYVHACTYDACEDKNIYVAAYYASSLFALKEGGKQHFLFNYIGF